jgi:retinol dehydrogenase-13
MDRKKTIKTCLITGSNSGIGKATAIEMAQRGYNILMLCRDSEKSRNAKAEIKAGSNEMKVDLVYVDFASLKSIENAASEITQKYDSIDVLINNAGVVKRKLTTSEDGLEMNLAVNFLAPFYLTNLLLPLLMKSDSARIINVTSELYKSGKIDMKNDYSKNQISGKQGICQCQALGSIVYLSTGRDSCGRENYSECSTPGGDSNRCVQRLSRMV